MIRCNWYNKPVVLSDTSNRNGGETDYLRAKHVAVTVEDLLHLIEQRNVAHVFGRLTSLADPDFAVNIHHEMFGFELLLVHKSQPRQTSEAEKKSL